MILRTRPALTAIQLISPLVVAGIAIALLSLLNPSARKKLSGLLIAGAGAAYLGGGFGWWELAACAAFTAVAYAGLKDYRFVGAGWVMHTGWDVAHHLYGNAIIPLVPLSSVGCAICDLGLAAWYFAGAPSVWARRPGASAA